MQMPGRNAAGAPVDRHPNAGTAHPVLGDSGATAGAAPRTRRPLARPRRALKDKKYEQNRIHRLLGLVASRC
jgi:hypothetical protein